MKRKGFIICLFVALCLMLSAAQAFAFLDSDIEIEISSPLDTLTSESGMVTIDRFPAEIAINTTAKVGTITGIQATFEGKTQEISLQHNISIENKENCGEYTITAQTDNGAVLTITVNVLYQAKAKYNIRYRTVTMHINEVLDGGKRIKSFSSPQRIDLVNANSIAEYEKERIAQLIGKKDGKTYTLKGSFIIEVYDYVTGIKGQYNVNEDFDVLTTKIKWTPETLMAFETMRNGAISYQAQVKIDVDAAWCSDNKQEVYGELSAQDKGVPEYFYPYKTTSVIFSKDDIPLGQSFSYKGLEWKYSPNTAEYTDGESQSQTSITQKINYKIPAANFYFKFMKENNPAGDNPEGSNPEEIPDNIPDPNPDDQKPDEEENPGPDSDEETPLDKDEVYDLGVQRITPDKYKENQTVISTIKVSNTGSLDFTPGQNVTVLSEIPELSLSKRVNAVVMEKDTYNVVSVKWDTPNVQADKNITLIAVINPDQVLDKEESNVNNTYTQRAVIKNVMYEQPIESITIPVPPQRSEQPRVTWKEQRYENDRFVWREFYAELKVNAVLDYDTKDKGYIKSGYGFTIKVTPFVSTNYDKLELITAPQTAEVYLPQYRYETAIPLMKDGNYFTFKENLDSPFRYKKQYVPVWFPDNRDYIVQLLVTDVHTPGGTLSKWITGETLTMKVVDSMYSDDVTTGS